MMRDATAQWAKDELAPLVRQMDDAGKMEPHIIQACFDNGFMGVEVPEEYGGCGSSFTAALLVVEELAKVDPSVSVMVDIHNTIVNNCFSYWASDRLKAKWLPRLTSDCLGAFCLSEATSGSDAFALRATARRDGGDFVLDGARAILGPSPNPDPSPNPRPRPSPYPRPRARRCGLLTVTLTLTLTLALTLALALALTLSLSSGAAR